MRIDLCSCAGSWEGYGFVVLKGSATRARWDAWWEVRTYLEGAHDSWQRKGQGFAGTCEGDAHHVSP